MGACRVFGLTVCLASSLLPDVALAERETIESTTPGEHAGDSDDGSKRPFAVAAALVPGVVLHGSGSWVLGKKETGEQLLLIEGIGVGATLVGLGGLAATGAARALAAPLIFTTIGGVGLFTLTLMADLYVVASPEGGFGRPRRVVPMLESRVGYLSIYDPLFSYRHFVAHGLRFQPGRVGLGWQGWHAPEQGNSRTRLFASVRPWGVSSARQGPFEDGSFLEFELATTQHDFDEEQFVVSTYEVIARHRLDATRVATGVEGAFAEFSAGYAYRSTAFEAFGETHAEDVLLGGFGFGTYLGDPNGWGGEAVLYYEHRHDDFAAGFKAPGLGSGVPGHIGLRSFYYLGSNYGLDGLAEVGSAWVLGLGLRARVGYRAPERNTSQ